MNDREPHLDTELIFERRVSLGLSAIDLASRLGVSTVTVRSLETGRNHDRLTLHFLARLAETLGLRPVDLLAHSRDEELEPAERDVKAEAALALIGRKISPTDLSLAFGWTLDETHGACRLTPKPADSTGIRVHYTGGRYGLAPARGVLSPAEIRALERACVRRRRLGVPEAGVLRRIFAAGHSGPLARRPERGAQTARRMVPAAGMGRAATRPPIHLRRGDRKSLPHAVRRDT